MNYTKYYNTNVSLPCCYLKSPFFFEMTKIGIFYLIDSDFKVMTVTEICRMNKKCIKV